MENSTFKVAVAECPECEISIRFRRQMNLGQIVICPECDTELKVSQLYPLELSWATDNHKSDYFDNFDEWD